MKHVMCVLIYKSFTWKARDDFTNVGFNAEDFRAARSLEMEYLEKLKVYDKVDGSELKRTGGKLIWTR